MAQSKKKTATRTTKKTTSRQAPRRKQACCKRAQAGISNQERMHLFVIAGMSIVAGILLCANAAMMMV